MSVYEGHGVTLHHADCLDVLRSLPDCSVDSVVCDPPYALGFMGREWDTFGMDVGRGAQARSQRRAEVTPTGEGHSTSAGPYLASGVDSLRAAGLPFQRWCEAWATECLRVLKPGGHLLAFGGTRTWHRLACAVEDAGFEVRDSIAWLYGSGFPKSLDVSKAIDKRPGVSQHPAFAAHLAERRQSAGLSRADVSEHVVGTRTGACWNWEHHQFPEAKWWPALRDLLDLDEAKWGPIIAEAERQKIGVKAGNRLAVAPGQGEDRSAIDLDVTTHATPDAERWQGWGTALKPSFEGIVCATKPVPALARIGSRLDELEQSCRPPASGAVPSSAPTHPDSLGARTASAPASAATRREDEPARTTPTGAAAGSSAATATSASELTGATFWNTVTSWKACWAELCEATSTSTTGTTSSTTTDLETLWSCLSQITPESTTTDPTSPDGLSSLVGAVDAMFAAAVLNSRATRTLTAIGSATSGTPPTSPAAGGSRAAFEPVVVARKPLAGTVAANVLEHGTGALNIDGCRVGDGGQLSWAEPRGNGYMGGGSNAGAVAATENAKGRWPANVVLDREMAEALDEQSGESRDGTAVKRNRSEDGRAPYEASSYMITDRSREDQTYGGQGGASRFFYVAKAPKGERPVAFRPSCNCETMKPWTGQSQPRDTAGSESAGDRSWNTSTSGSSTMDATSPRGTTSTTETATSSTTTSGTSNSSRSSSTSESTPVANSETASGGSPAPSAANSSPSTSSTGTSARKAGPSTADAGHATSGEWSETSACGRCGAPAKREAHPTVKPLSLMRWLVRLVTPPGGTVLEPFAGSGTTVEACIVEGFQCIAIEREADYLPLIRQRIDRRREPVEALRGQAADLGLFDLLGGEGA